jgi:hypothetical protein
LTGELIIRKVGLKTMKTMISMKKVWMNTIHQQNNSDRLLGVIRLPIQLSKTVGRGCSGTVCSLPLRFLLFSQKR